MTGEEEDTLTGDILVGLMILLEETLTIDVGVVLVLGEVSDFSIVLK